MKVAIEGCCHGCLTQIYSRLDKAVDLLLICGDFQAIRTKKDLKYMNVPDKYKQLGDFHQYYNGQRKAPVMTIFIGGNHEDSNYLQQLKYGGFVAPNIYFLGRSNVIWYKGLRIGGLSGIYDAKDFMQKTPEDFDFTTSWASRKAYHLRKDDYFKMRLLKQDNRMVMLSHDWPEGIYEYGNKPNLLKIKPWFKKDVATHTLGNPYGMQLLKHIKPKNWFSAHLHIHFTAELEWKKRKMIQKDTEVKKQCLNDDEIDLNLSDTNDDTCGNGDEIALDISDEESALDEEVQLKPTKFIALDKCLPRRKFIEKMQIEVDKQHPSFKNSGLYFDPEYISILRSIPKYQPDFENLTSEELMNPPHLILERMQEYIQAQLAEFGALSHEEYSKRFIIPGFKRSFTNDSGKETNPQTQKFIEKYLLSL